MARSGSQKATCLNCKKHSTREAIAACVECGNFFCRDCLTPVKRKNYCSDCAKKLLEEETRPSKPIVFQQQQQQGGDEKGAEPEAPTDWGLLVSWLISGIFFFMALGTLMSGAWTFIWPLLTALMWLPPLSDWLKREKNFEIPVWAKIIATFVLLVLLGVTAPKTSIK